MQRTGSGIRISWALWGSVILPCSVWVGLPPACVAVACSGHMALIWVPSVSVSLSKVCKTPRVPPVSQPQSVTAALRISPLFTVARTSDVHF